MFVVMQCLPFVATQVVDSEVDTAVRDRETLPEPLLLTQDSPTTDFPAPSPTADASEASLHRSRRHRRISKISTDSESDGVEHVLPKATTVTLQESSLACEMGDVDSLGSKQDKYELFSNNASTNTSLKLLTF